MKTTVITCDVCEEKAHFQEQKIQVIFTTEQTEGRNCKPYLSIQIMDICDQCMRKILNGNAVWGNGAQGHNNYKING